MAKLVTIDGWNKWISEVDGGTIPDGLFVVTENMPLPTNYPEILTSEQLAQTGRAQSKSSI